MTSSESKPFYTLLFFVSLVLSAVSPALLYAYEPEGATVTDTKQEAADYYNGNSGPATPQNNTTPTPSPTPSGSTPTPTPTPGPSDEPASDNGSGRGDGGGPTGQGPGTRPSGGDGNGGPLPSAKQQRTLENEIAQQSESIVNDLIEGVNSYTGNMLGDAAANIGVDLTDIETIHKSIRESNGQQAISGDDDTYGDTSFDTILDETVADRSNFTGGDGMNISGGNEVNNDTLPEGGGGIVSEDEGDNAQPVILDWNPTRYLDPDLSEDRIGTLDDRNSEADDMLIGEGQLPNNDLPEDLTLDELETQMQDLTPKDQPFEQSF